MNVSIGQKELGEGCPTYITFEAGPTHQGFESAKRLCQVAADAGADAIKFQIIDADRLVADKNLEISYGVLDEGKVVTVSEPLINPLRQRMMSREEWRDLKKFSDSLNLAFFATVGFKDEVDFLVEIGCHSIKIASADIDHHSLIEYAAKSGLCIQLDTGHATIGEVEAAVDLIRRTGNNNIVIHHCPTGYPARLEGINLNTISTLRKMFEFPIAFSDHSTGWEMDIAAIALGANMVEKTLSEDRSTRGVEHIMSLEPSEAKSFVGAIRELESAFGRPRRVLDDEERQKRRGNRRSLFTIKNLEEGQTLNEADIDFRRPGYGITPLEAKSYFGRKVRNSLKEGHLLTPEDFY